MTGGYMVQSLHDPDQADKDGFGTVLYPGMRPGRARFGYPTPTRRRKRKMERRGARLRRQRRERIDYHRLKYILARIERDNFRREVEEAIQELVASGDLRMNPDGTFQMTTLGKLRRRRQDARS